MSSSAAANLVAWVLTALLLLVVIISQLAASGRIRRNGYAGIRIPPTLVSDAAWVAGHRAAAKFLWAGFALTLAAAIVAQFSAIGPIPCVLLFVATLVGSIVAAWRGARRA